MWSRRLDAAAPILVLQKVDGNENFVEINGLRLATHTHEARAWSWPCRMRRNGDPCWDRTSDTLIKSQVLYQLS